MRTDNRYLVHHTYRTLLYRSQLNCKYAFGLRPKSFVGPCFNHGASPCRAWLSLRGASNLFPEGTLRRSSGDFRE